MLVKILFSELPVSISEQILLMQSCIKAGNSAGENFVSKITMSIGTKFVDERLLKDRLECWWNFVPKVISILEQKFVNAKARKDRQQCWWFCSQSYFEHIGIKMVHAKLYIGR